MTRRSAGLLLYRFGSAGLETMLVHPGGPFWARRDDGAWTIPKGEYGGDENPEAAARREFTEETGLPVPPGPVWPLGDVVQRRGKIVTAFALQGDLRTDRIRSNEIEIIWPPRSGRRLRVAEIDRAAWFDMRTARTKLIEAQRAFLDRLAAGLDGGAGV